MLPQCDPCSHRYLCPLTQLQNELADEKRKNMELTLKLAAIYVSGGVTDGAEFLMRAFESFPPSPKK